MRHDVICAVYKYTFISLARIKKNLASHFLIGPYVVVLTG